MTDIPIYIDEDHDVDWIAIDCSEFERILNLIGRREVFGADASQSEREKLSVYAGYTNTEGYKRSRTIWGNEKYGLILKWTGYTDCRDTPSRKNAECREYVAGHALTLIKSKETMMQAHSSNEIEPDQRMDYRRHTPHIYMDGRLACECGEVFHGTQAANILSYARHVAEIAETSYAVKGASAAVVFGVSND